MLNDINNLVIDDENNVLLTLIPQLQSIFKDIDLSPILDDIDFSRSNAHRMTEIVMERVKLS
jgi:hypothetical protein